VSRGKPAVIALNILFVEPSSRGPADNQALAQAISRSGMGPDQRHHGS
jgi:CHASE2 domain-containing sensor protein